MPAAASITVQALPIGLASKVKLGRAVKKGQVVTLNDIDADSNAQAWQVRAKMLLAFT